MKVVASLISISTQASIVFIVGRSSHIGGRCKLTLNGKPFGKRICTFDQEYEPDVRWDMGSVDFVKGKNEIVFENCGRHSDSDSYSLFFSRILFVSDSSTSAAIPSPGSASDDDDDNQED